MHEHSFSDRILVQMATGGLVGAVADRMLTVAIGMLASLFVGVVMEFVKLRIQAGNKKRDLEALRAIAPSLPPSQTSGGFCAVPSRPTIPPPAPRKAGKRKF